MIEAKKSKDKFNIDVEEMTKLGLNFGHRTSRINPKMKPYIAGIRSGINIIDLEKTKECLVEALDFIQKLVAENKVLLLVGTKIQIKTMVKSLAEECNLPYISERWLGGTFTNMVSILKRVEYYKDLEKKRAAGELDKYTKKERADFDQELKRLEIKFKGIKELTRLPEAIFVCDMLKDKLAVKEARAKGIKVISICDTNVDPTLVDYPIPASDDTISSVRYILEKVKEAILNTELPAEAKVKKRTQSSSPAET